MKKLFVVTLAFLQLALCGFLFTGCNGGGFKVVKSITITTGGYYTGFESSTKGEAQFKSTSITKEEFDNAPDDRKYYKDYNKYNYSGFNKKKVVSKISIESAIKSANNKTIYEVVENELKGSYYEVVILNYGVKDLEEEIGYTKYEYEKTTFNFVYVKIKNDTTLVIRSDNAETTYTVTSYSITEF